MKKIPSLNMEHGWKKPKIKQAVEISEFAQNRDAYPIENPNRERNVEKRERKQKYFTALRGHYKVGDVITGRPTNSEISKPSVFLTTSEEPHHTLSGRPDLKQYTIYRVIPTEKVRAGNLWGELAASEVRIVEVVGSAKNFVNGGKYSSVPVRDRNPDLEKNTTEYYHELNVKSPNEKGRELLEGIEKRHGNV